MTVTFDLNLTHHQSSRYVMGWRLLDDLPHFLSTLSYDQVFMVYDQGLPADLLHGPLALPLLSLYRIGISGREEAKTWQTVEKILHAFHQIPLSRQCLILAVGGGVIGDVVGLAASLYKRGVSWAFIPTTLIAQIDSSIGGKTAINTEHGKNQLGTFHCPRLVLADLSVLKSLPRIHLNAGMAEVIKIAAMASPSLLSQLHDVPPCIEALEDIWKKAAALKIAVVEDDLWEEKELGRSRLNFGHTIGHALEIHYQPDIIHGQAVAIGMMIEMALAQKWGYGSFSKAWIKDFHGLIQKFIPESKAYPLPSWQTLLPLLRQDKKNTHQKVRFIVPHASHQAQAFTLESHHFMDDINL